MIELTHAQVTSLVSDMDDDIRNFYGKDCVKVYPVPRGGIPIAYLLNRFGDYEVVDNIVDATIIVDDIIDSGTTMERLCDEHPGKPFYAPINKQDPKSPFRNHWVQFPWEKSIFVPDDDDSATDIVVRLLQYIGEDFSREGLAETPKRFLKAMKHWTSGYKVDPKEVLKVFKDGGEKYDQMVMVKNIPIYSKCEHHLADIFGTATVAYIPNGKIVGLSKISRLVDIFARRLQVQERLTQQIADAINENLSPLGVGVLINARHMCMESRGICQQGHSTVTTAFHGVLLEDVAARNEFMQLAHSK